MHEVLLGSEYVDAFINECAVCKTSIRLLFYFWQPRPGSLGDPITRIVAAMLAAKERGVSVQILSSSAAIVSFFKQAGLDARQFHTGKTMHVKLAIFDDVTAFVGSHNMTRNAMKNNWEISLRVQFPDSKNKLVTFFQNIWVL